MHHTAINAAPTITLLTRSPLASRKTQSIFKALFGMRPIGEPSTNRNEHGVSAAANTRISDVCNRIKKESMNEMFHPLLQKNWDSVASIDDTSGTILHFLSLSSSKNEEEQSDELDSNDFGLSLLSVTEGSNDIQSGPDAVLDPEAISESVVMARRVLASHVEEHSNPKTLGLKLAALHAINKPVTHSRLMGRENDGIPLLKLPTTPCNNETSDTSNANCENNIETPLFRLREIVLPYFDDAMCASGRSLLSEFSSSSLSRPLTGLYQWPLSTSLEKKNGVAFRPLPCGTEDLNLPLPTLVFQCQSIEEAKANIEEMGGIAAKVGFSGNNQQGQLRVMGLGALAGLDVRYCESEAFSTSFAEAEEAVMDGSLD